METNNNISKTFQKKIEKLKSKERSLVNKINIPEAVTFYQVNITASKITEIYRVIPKNIKDTKEFIKNPLI